MGRVCSREPIRRVNGNARKVPRKKALEIGAINCRSWMVVIVPLDLFEVDVTSLIEHETISDVM